jgi:hypothetical protein
MVSLDIIQAHAARNRARGTRVCILREQNYICAISPYTPLSFSPCLFQPLELASFLSYPSFLGTLLTSGHVVLALQIPVLGNSLRCFARFVSVEDWFSYHTVKTFHPPCRLAAETSSGPPSSQISHQTPGAPFVFAKRWSEDSSPGIMVEYDQHVGTVAIAFDPYLNH